MGTLTREWVMEDENEYVEKNETSGLFIALYGNHA